MLPKSILKTWLKRHSDLTAEEVRKAVSSVSVTGASFLIKSCLCKEVELKPELDAEDI